MPEGGVILGLDPDELEDGLDALDEISGDSADPVADLAAVLRQERAGRAAIADEA